MNILLLLIPISLGLGAAGLAAFWYALKTGQFDDPPATMKTYAFALEDVLASFEALGARDELPRLFVDMVNKGIDAGLEDKALTALVPLLAEEGET